MYVDDIIVTGSSDSEVTTLISQLNHTFALKDMGALHYFLGIEVKSTTASGLLLTQTKYIQDLLKKAQMDESKPYATPMVSSCKLSSRDGSPFHDPTLYRTVVGSLQYITITRPELAYCVNRV